MKKIKEKACRKCKALVSLDTKKCPVCGNDSFTKLWEGYIIIIDPGKSVVAEKIGAQIAWKYAIRIAR